MLSTNNSGNSTSTVTPSDSSPSDERETGTRVFLGFLFVVATFYAVVLIYHAANPPQSTAANSGLLERCRQICMKYGLVSTGNLRRDAETYIKAVHVQPLTNALSEILSQPEPTPVSSQAHALLQQSVPDFSLPDDQQTRKSLSDLGSNRPVVVVFYLGYGCSHCVAQLVALEKDLHYFRELDAEIIAISADSPEHTAQRFAEYGRFGFPVLSDADRAVASQWQCLHPATDETPELMDHGTFIVDRTGKMIWACRGKEPFLDNRTLLKVLAQSQGLMPNPVAQRQ